VISVVWASKIKRENSGAPTSKREILRRAKKKKKGLYPIGDGENKIKTKSQELGPKTKGPTMGLEPTWV
jgi:hypothetical protein